jgi:carboxylesterase
LAVGFDTTKTAALELGSGRKACLLMHGFTGSPWDLAPLAEALAAQGYYVRVPRLPGHGTTPEAMLNVTHQDWEQTGEEILGTMAEGRRVFVGGLSMGALLALRLSVRAPKLVAGLALMAPALRFVSPSLRLLARMPESPLLELIRPYVAKTATDIEDEAALREAPILPAFPSARLRDVWALQRSTRAVLDQVRAPTLVLQARGDRVVDRRGARELVRSLKSAQRVRYVEISEGRHIMPRDLGRALVAAEVIDFFGQVDG